MLSKSLLSYTVKVYFLWKILHSEIKSDSNFDKNDNKRTGSFIIEKAGTVAAGGMAQFG